MPRVYAASDIVTISSAFAEAFPNVLGEAMACAVPTVVTDIGDCARIVGKTGIVVAPGSPRALVSAWEHLIGRRVGCPDAPLGRAGAGASGGGVLARDDRAAL